MKRGRRHFPVVPIGKDIRDRQWQREDEEERARCAREWLEQQRHSAENERERETREERREAEKRLRTEAANGDLVNHKLFGPPVRIPREQREKLRRLFDANVELENPLFVVTLTGAKRRRITIDDYRNRKTKPVEFIVSVPDSFEQLCTSPLLKPEHFSNDDIFNCVRAAIRTLPSHIAAAFTVSDYLWPKPVAAKAASLWPCNIIGFDPLLPPPIRQPPYYKLNNNFSIAPPASAAQHRYWKKHWRRLESIILNDVRTYLMVMVRLIMVEYVRVKRE